jgi:hypothetical protein
MPPKPSIIDIIRTEPNVSKSEKPDPSEEKMNVEQEEIKTSIKREQAVSPITSTEKVSPGETEKSINDLKERDLHYMTLLGLNHSQTTKFNKFIDQ